MFYYNEIKYCTEIKLIIFLNNKNAEKLKYSFFICLLSIGYIISLKLNRQNKYKTKVT